MPRDKIDIREVPDGVIVSVIVKPKGRGNAIIGIHDGAVKVSVTAAPEKGKANSAVVALLAKFFGVSKDSVIIRTGETARRKTFLLEGMTRQEIYEALSTQEIE